MSLAPDLRPVDSPPANDDQPLLSPAMRFAIGLFVVIPLASVLFAIPVLWGGWLGWTDVLLAVLFWAITALGITLGYHRYFTHGSFKTNRALKIVLAITGSMALQGSLDQWVADHRKHHQFTDEVGDPHSPWRFGTSRRAVAKGLAFAHVGWLFSSENTSIRQYAPDIDDDADLRRISAWFPAIALFSMVAPAILGGLITWSWIGALTAFFWAGLFRIAFVHHVTWSINSICHVFGTRPFASRDLSTNVAWLAIPSFGESWHNLHHVDPTAARHGVLRGQLDISAEIIRGLENINMVTDVRWPKPERLAKKLKDPEMRFRLRGYQESA
jgi:stearoyl-CoA desaturase (Delta-9 desaturase)